LWRWRVFWFLEKEVKKSFNNLIRRYWWVLVLPLLVPSFSRLIHKGFFPTQDFIYVARIYEMDKSLADGQFPVRWVPDFRYGEPLFNFYAPLPYYLGSVVHAVGLSFLDTVKVLFSLSFVLSFFSMYFLGRELWGKTGGVISAFVYLYAPYRALDVFVRGDLSESWVFVFFPLIFLGALRLSKKVDIKNMALLSLSLAGLFYAHNILTMLFAPFFLLWIIYLAWSKRNIKILVPLVSTSLLGVGVAASFLLPAFFERSFIQVHHLTGGYFDFRGHFVEIKQLFSTFWGYGASVWGNEDGMSFQLGVVNWIIFGLIVVLGFIKRKSLLKDKTIYLLGVLFASFALSLFMQHNRSTFIWVHIPYLEYVQFPWRFMAISIFMIAILAGSLVKLIPKLHYLVLGAAVILVIATTYNFFRPDFYYNDSIDAHYIGQQILSQDDKLPKDYLPVWVKAISSEKITQPTVISGQAAVSNFVARSDSATFNLDVANDATLEVPITYFPGWQVKLNGQKVTLGNPSDLGLITFSAPAGEYNVSVNFGNTPLRTAGNAVSVISAGILLFLAFYSRTRFRKKIIAKG
jgi:hypothetical protein